MLKSSNSRMVLNGGGPPLGALGYWNDRLVAVEIGQKHLPGTVAEWVEKGYRVELTTEQDAIETAKRDMRLP